MAKNKRKRSRKKNNLRRWTDEPEYGVWTVMIQRCEDRGCHAYPGYGGRGITVCDRWRNSYEAFLEDMGTRPSDKHSLDRYPDNNKGYEPGNCRWATRSEQQRNTRSNRLLEYNGKTLCIVEWSEIIGLNQLTIHSRLNRGWSVERALTEPRHR